VLKDLSKAAHVDLRTSPETENEILLISVRQVPLTDLMVKIARVTSGSWRHEGKSFRLVPYIRLRNQAAAAVSAQKTDDVIHFVSSTLTTQEGALITDLLLQFNPPTLANIHPSDRRESRS